jgi:hypothetical protein
MKKIITKAAFLVALALPFAAQAVTKVEDAVVGAVITDGIKMHGFFDSAPLPLPPGGWTVLYRSDETEDWPGTKLDFVKLVLASNNPEFGVGFIKVRFNPDTARVGYKYNECKYDGINSMVNSFGSTSSQFLYRCAIASYVRDVHRTIPFHKKDPSGRIATDDFYSEHMDVLKGVIEISKVFFDARKSNGRLTSYEFVLLNHNSQSVTFYNGQPFFDSIESWIQKTGDKLGEFLDGKTVSLPPFKVAE